MTDKEKYVNVAELKKKVRYWAKTRGMSNLALKAFFDMINNLPVTVKCDLETTLDEETVGEWRTDKVAFMKTCSECGKSVDLSHDYNYCPKCGVKMFIKEEKE